MKTFYLPNLLLSPLNWIYNKGGNIHYVCHSRYGSSTECDADCGTCDGEGCKEWKGETNQIGSKYPIKDYEEDTLVFNFTSDIDMTPFLEIAEDPSNIQYIWNGLVNVIRNWDIAEYPFDGTNILLARTITFSALEPLHVSGYLSDKAFKFYTDLFNLYRSLYNYSNNERDLTEYEIINLIYKHPNYGEHLVSAETGYGNGKVYANYTSDIGYRFDIVATTITCADEKIYVLDMLFSPAGYLTKIEGFMNAMPDNDTTQRLGIRVSDDIRNFLYGKLSEKQFIKNCEDNFNVIIWSLK
jgi:hypothetical protein